jgi:hypothetical protein
MDNFRGGNPHHARKFRNEAFGGFEAIIIAKPLADRLTHRRSVDVAVLRALVDDPALDGMGYQIKVLLHVVSPVRYDTNRWTFCPAAVQRLLLREAAVTSFVALVSILKGGCPLAREEPPFGFLATNHQFPGIAGLKFRSPDS